MKKLFLLLTLVACTPEPRFHGIDPPVPVPECPVAVPAPEPTPLGYWIGESALVTLDGRGFYNNFDAIFIVRNSAGAPELQYTDCESLVFSALGPGYWALLGGPCRGLTRGGQAWLNADGDRLFLQVTGFAEGDLPDMDYWPPAYSLNFSLFYLGAADGLRGPPIPPALTRYMETYGDLPCWVLPYVPVDPGRSP